MVVIAGLSMTWSLATPLFDGPDEYAHAARAYAIFSGELVPPSGTSTRAGDLIPTPASFDRQEFRYPRCLIARPEATPNCLPPVVSAHGEHRAPSSAGRYPPLYYVMVGLPLKLFPGTFGGLLLARLLSALLSAMFLASAVLSAFQSKYSSCLLAGLVVAIPPEVLYTNGVVNPSAFEVSAAIAVWMAGLVLVTERDTRGDWRLMARLGVASLALVAVKASGPLLLLLIAMVLLALAKPSRLLLLARDRTFIGWGATVGLAAVGSVAWTLLVHPNSLDPTRHVRALGGTAKLVRTSIGLWDGWARQMVGNFGYADLPAPQLTHYVWLLLVGALLVAAAVASSPRLAVALAVLLTIVLVAPVIGSTLIARSIGFGYQGRYTLPVAVGLPLLAALAVGTRLSGSAVQRRLLVVVTALAGTAHLAAFSYVLHRFAVGQSGPLIFWTHPLWSPVLPPALLLLTQLALVASAVALAAVAACSTGGRREGAGARREATVAA